MTQITLAANLTKVFVQAAFIASILFAAIYTALRFRWWETVTGRAIICLDLGIAGALMHGALVIWGLPTYVVVGNDHAVNGANAHVSFGPWWSELLNWLSVVSLGVATVAILVLLWQAVRFAYVDNRNGNRPYSKVLNAILFVKTGQRGR